MKRYLLIALLLVSLSANAQRVAPALIEALQTTNLLDADRRDQLASLLADSTLVLPIDLGQSAQLTEVQSQSISLTTSEVGSAQLFLLPLVNGTSLVALIQTVTEPQDDSRLTFLDAQGRPLRTQLITMPRADQFLPALPSEPTPQEQRLRELLSPLHMTLQWDPRRQQLLARPSLDLSVEDETNGPLLQLITKLPTLSATWQGTSFTPFTPSL